MLTNLEVDAPEVAIDRQPAIVIKPPVKGDGWLDPQRMLQAQPPPRSSRRHRRPRIETAEAFAIDWAKVKNGRIFDGDGSKNEQHYAFERGVLAVADGTVVSSRTASRRRPRTMSMVPETKEDYGGNHVILKIAPNVFALYVHLHTGSVAVKVGDVVKAGHRLPRSETPARSMGPHLHFGLSDKPDFFAGQGLPFVFDSFARSASVDFDASEGDHLVITPDSRQVRSAYPLYGGVQNYP